MDGAWLIELVVKRTRQVALLTQRRPAIDRLPNTSSSVGDERERLRGRGEGDVAEPETRLIAQNDGASVVEPRRQGRWCGSPHSARQRPVMAAKMTGRGRVMSDFVGGRAIITVEQMSGCVKA